MNHGKGNQQQQHHQAAVVHCQKDRVLKSKYYNKVHLQMFCLSMSSALKNGIKISLLVPSYRRFGRLIRLVCFLNGASKVDRFASFFKNSEILIADGSPLNFDFANHQKLESVIREISNNLDIRFFSCPDSSMLSRQQKLLEESTGQYVAWLGDEDLPNVDFYPQALKLLNDRKDLAAVGGRYADIKGFRKGKLFFCLQEGWLDSIEISSIDPLFRLHQYSSLYHLGMPSVYYSLMPRSVVANYLEIALPIQSKISLNDCESILQFSVFMFGSAIVLPKTHVLRDFTMLDHNSDMPGWRLADGEEDYCAMALSIYLARNNFFASNEDALRFINSLQPKSFGSSSPRKQLQGIIDKSQSDTFQTLVHEIDDGILKLAADAWKKTAVVCYSPKALSVIGLNDHRNIVPFLTRLKHRIQGLIARH